MDFDEKQYVTTVLRPTGGNPAELPDPLRRYGFIGDPPADEEEFRIQVDAVYQVWTGLANKPGWRWLKKLITDHKERHQKGSLTLTVFLSDSAVVQARLARQLTKRVSAENLTHCGPELIRQIRRSVPGVDESKIRLELAAAEIVVLDELPILPLTEPPGYASLRTALRYLDRRLSAEVVFGTDRVRAGFALLDGFQLNDGTRLDRAAVTPAQQECEKLPYENHAKSDIANVLKVVAKAIEAGAVATNDLLLWEVVELLRDGAGAGDGQRALAGQAADLGLNNDEAGQLAAAVIEERLRNPGSDDPSPSAPASVMVSTSTSANAEADAQEVLLTWAPSPSNRSVVYRVTRTIGHPPASPADGATIARQTREPQAVDEDPPPGERLHYAVFAASAAHANRADWQPRWSEPAHADVIIVTPEVAGFSLQPAGPGSVACTWKRRADRTRVQAFRVNNGGRTAIETGPTGFTDTGLTPGLHYSYLISASYTGSDGIEHDSPGTSASITLAPLPVSALEVAQAGDLIQVSLTSPPAGLVDLVWTKTNPANAPGAQLDQAALAQLGKPAPGHRWSADGQHVTVDLAPPPGRNFLLAVTRADDWAIAGASIVFGDVEPVTGLTARRQVARLGRSDQAQVSWIWPTGAAAALVRWPANERRCSRLAYFNQGGLTIAVGPAETVISVSATYLEVDGEQTAEPAFVTIPASKPKASYRWRRSGTARRKNWQLEILAEVECELPRLTVVRSTGPVPPGGPADGVQIGTCGPALIGPGQPLRYVIDAPGDEADFVACFVADDDDADLLLFPPPPNDLRAR